MRGMYSIHCTETFCTILIFTFKRLIDLAIENIIERKAKIDIQTVAK
jgi:hypothetical protein